MATISNYRKTHRDDPSGQSLLRMIPADLKVFDNLSISSGQESELSGPFSEFDMCEPFIEKRRSQDLRETDVYSYFSFSEEFRSAMENVKSKNMVDTDEQTALRKKDPSVDAEEDSPILRDLEKRVEALLKENDELFFPEKKTEEEVEEEKVTSDAKGKRKSKAKDEKSKGPEVEEEYFDTMSGYWRMLSAYDEFKISPPRYDAYDGDVPHWLETKPIPFEQMEAARTKCLEWLNENLDNY